MIGAQASNDQLEKILSYVDIGKKEGAKLLAGGERAKLNGDLTEGYYMQPTVFEGNNKMRIFQEEIFGPVLSVTPFDTDDEALSIANDTLYGLGAGIWTRDMNRAYRFGRGIQAGRVWTNCYHLYPAHAAFGGYKKSGIGRETHKMMLDHYQQTKNVLVSYSPKAMGFLVETITPRAQQSARGSRQCHPRRPVSGNEKSKLSGSGGDLPAPRFISSSKTPGTMTTPCGRCPFSNIANRSASVRLTKIPPHMPRWSWTTQFPRLSWPIRKSEDLEQGASTCLMDVFPCYFVADNLTFPAYEYETERRAFS